MDLVVASDQDEFDALSLETKKYPVSKVRPDLPKILSQFLETQSFRLGASFHKTNELFKGLPGLVSSAGIQGLPGPPKRRFLLKNHLVVLSDLRKALPVL